LRDLPQPTVTSALVALDLDHRVRVVGLRVEHAHQELAHLSATNPHRRATRLGFLLAVGKLRSKLIHFP
jgi:hypothetical protein